MRSYTDADGRTWTLALDGWSLRECQRQLGLNLLKLFDDHAKLADELLSDMELLGGVLWLLCSDQAKAAEVDERAFAKGHREGVLMEAVNQLLNAVIDFFPKAGQPALRKQLELSRRIVNAAAIASSEVLSELEKLLTPIEHTANSLNSVGSSESITDTLPSES